MSRSFRRGLWSLVRRMFGAPKGRHVIGATQDPASLAEAEPRIPLIPDFVASAVQASPAVVPPTTGLASIQLIFTDGSVVALSEGSVEGRQAQYLARRVLEAGRPS